MVAPHDPVSCLRAMKLTHVRTVGGGWSGSFAGVDGTRYAIEVDRMASALSAQAAVRRSDLVYAGSGGRFMVTGPARWGTRGATTDQIDGEITSLDVLGVAACLSRSTS